MDILLAQLQPLYALGLVYIEKNLFRVEEGLDGVGVGRFTNVCLSQIFK